MSMLLVLAFCMILLPLGGSLLLLMIGRRMGEPLAGYVGTGIAMITCAFSVATMIAWIYGATTWGYQVAPFVDSIKWLPIGEQPGQRVSGFLDLTLYIDSLTIVMATMVAFVSAIVHLFSMGYMRSDPRYAQFFCYLSLFSFCMIGLLFSGSLIQMLIFWELVGLCSYLLIGFWREKPEASYAAIKAFVVNRVGDVGFIIGIGLLVAHVGNLTLPDLWLRLQDGTGGGWMSPTMLSVIGGLLFCGAIAKSAQFPLQTWLPDAMAGPTPVSALIHAATMVAAGVFLLARIYPILTADARLFVLIIGATTILIGSLCAMAQRDIKKALAFSTIAQLGYMVVAIGVGSWVGAMFHLLTHAFFKALLFLGAGAVIHAMHHDSRLEHFGGLFRRLPVTAITFAVGALAMSGAPYLSGFYSKDMILAHAAAWCGVAGESHRAGLLQLALWIPVIGAYLTPLYMARLWMLTFAGRPRKRSLYREAREPGVMSFSLTLLTGLTVVSGYAWFPVQSMVESAIKETRGYYASLGMGAIDPLRRVWPTLSAPSETVNDETGTVESIDLVRTTEELRVEAGYTRAHRLTGWAWLAGILCGVVIYLRGFAVTDRLGQFAPFRAVRHWLANRMYFDDFYEFVFLGVVQIGTSVATAIDKHLIDPLLDRLAGFTAKAGRNVAMLDDAAVDGAVRAVTSGVWQSGSAVRLTQNGRIRGYVAGVVAAVVVGIASVIVFMIQR